ncbi:hypothetical protein WJX72_006906 [[Myrmecia] bisecta]|uniref:Aldehyde dehydrogenase domain-containing protein n=1 Tax=[Myrmecia] bisecta TaxID=41462 RepID=A0AAW1PTD5_9CHLO
MSIPARQLYIAGKWVAPVHAGRFPVMSPRSESEVGSIPNATAEDVDRAVAAAAAAHADGGWGRSLGRYRAGFLRAIAKKVKDDKTQLAKLETIDCGKPIQEAEWDMDDVAGCFEYYAELAEKLDARQDAPINVGMDDFRCRVRREPLGVVALITPWNYPLLMAAWKVAPALAAGNCVVLKPSEVASVTCLELAAIVHDVGVPAGVFNLITGTGQDAGAPLSAHPGIAKVAFTGSVATGKRVALAAAANVKPATLELGGKSALIVFEDADIANAVEWCMFGAFWTVGQICTATSRLLVHESIATEFYAQLKRRAESIKICDPLIEDCRLGPVVNKSQHDKILQFIQVAQQQGATLLTGGKRPAHLAQGYFVEPTVFVDMKAHMQLWTDEVFGPVLASCTFRTEAEAIEMANSSIYGLAAAVISADEQRCKRVAEAMQSGIVWVNCAQPCFVQAPWGGVKASGHGRELGEWGLESFLSVKQVTTYVSKEKWGWFPSSQSKL